MSKRAIALTSVITVVTALAAGAYLWVQATYVLPAASCGLWAMPGQLPGTPGAAQCFAAAARTIPKVLLVPNEASPMTPAHAKATSDRISDFAVFLRGLRTCG